MNRNTSTLAALLFSCLGLNSHAEVIADSSVQFSQTQGENSWFHGYRNYSATGLTDYNASSEFIEFTAAQWDGSGFVLPGDDSGPFTRLGKELTHPNAATSSPGEEHWPIRRWVADVTEQTNLAIKWTFAATDVGGRGATGSLHINGKQVDFGVFGSAQLTPVSRRFYAIVQPGDIIDLALSPQDELPGRTDGSDETNLKMEIDDFIPTVPLQPDGSRFIPATAEDTDADLLPDAWELQFFPGDLTQLTGSGDNDGDGLINTAEVARGTDPTKQDSDGDGLLDPVETGTGVFVSNTQTGSEANTADTDGDGRSDGDEVNGTPSTDPIKADTDGDGTNDSDEIANGTDPNDATGSPILANSILQFSEVQGQNGWSHGYRIYDGQDDYGAATEFLPFAPEHWDGSKFALPGGEDGPFTELGPRVANPNGAADAPGEEHWPIHRWSSDVAEPTNVAITWTFAALDTAGRGTTGSLHVNGALVDFGTFGSAQIPPNDRTFYYILQPGDIVDLALTPLDELPGRTSFSDESVIAMVISTTLPEIARQPDGSIFVRATPEDSDGDTLPDAWELMFSPGDLTALTPDGDNDGDGLENTRELARGSDPTKMDTDGDGLSDLVETGTGIFFSALATGTDPAIIDTDEDGRTDGEEVNNSPTSNPVRADTDGDGVSDGDEITNGTDPSVPDGTTTIASSVIEFSMTQGQDGWFHGYRNYSSTGQTDYDPTSEFIAFTPGQWTGNGFELPGSSTALAREVANPNGVESDLGEEHWPIRRWVADVAATTTVAIRWRIGAVDIPGRGMAGSLHLNGLQVDSRVIPGSQLVPIEHTYYAIINPGDVIDLALTPENELPERDASSDESVISMIIDTNVPENPVQPDGTSFTPPTEDDTDADRLPDNWEFQFFPGDLTMLDALGDNDTDGLNNSREFARGTDPTKADTDGDGLSDGAETKTGVFVDATDTGTDPTKADTDGDGRPDGEEINGDIKTSPVRADTDGDGFSDGRELAEGFDPLDPESSPVVAYSLQEFSGNQGQDGWFYGYRNFSTDGGRDAYDPEEEFIEFGTDDDLSWWSGEVWDWPGGNTPWTDIRPDSAHPNGSNHAEVHWAVRRWVVDFEETTPIRVSWSAAKANAGGNGTTAGLYLNGTPLDLVVLAAADTTGVNRDCFINAEPGDRIDLIVSPRGTDGLDTDASDRTFSSMTVDLRIPESPLQHDGTPFVPFDNSTPKLPPVIQSIAHSHAAGDISVTWSSQLGSTYALERSDDLEGWTEAQAGIPGADGTTTFSDPAIAPSARIRFYRVRLEP